MSDDQLRAMYSKVLAAREPKTRDACVPPEALLALVERRGSEDERLRTLDHAMTCAACGRDLAMLRAVRTTQPRTTFRIAPFAIAASILIVAGIAAPSIARLVRGNTELLRGDDEVQLVGPRGIVPNELPMDLVWHRVPEASGYDVTILDENGTRIVQRTTTDTTATLGLDSALRRDVDYAWTVTAHLPDDDDRKSAAVTFRLRAP